MKNTTILIPKGEVSLSQIESITQMFSAVNEALEESGAEPAFQLEMVAFKHVNHLSNGITLNVEKHIYDLEQTDLIIIPEMKGDIDTILAENKEVLGWLIVQQSKGVEIAALSKGAIMLIGAGLLKNKQCTTHWMIGEELKRKFPETKLQLFKVLTDEDGLYTSAGGYSFLNLLLYLVEKNTSREMSLLMSKIFEVDIDRNSQSPFIIFRGLKHHGDDPVKRAQEYIEENYKEKLSVDQLAEKFLIGRRSLERRFKKATENTVIEYIQRVKMEEARKSLEASQDSVHEIMAEVGYSDPKAFREVFRKMVGISPVEYRAMLNKQMTGLRHTPAEEQ